MRLQTFRIRYCFGFVDSGEIDLKEPHNLVWVLGRNSSGKSSVLRALEQLAFGNRPDEHPKFANFDPPPGNEYGKLEAMFSISPGDLSAEPAVDLVVDAFSDMPVNIEKDDGRFAAPDNQRINAVLEAVQDGYETLVSEIEKVGQVHLVKDYDAEYWIFPLSDESDKLRTARKSSIKDALSQGIQKSSSGTPTDQWVVDSTAYQFAVSFEDLEAIFYRQFSNVFLFEKRFALGNDLPQVISDDFLKGDRNQVAQAFVSLLDEAVVQRWLKSNNLYTRQKLLDDMQDRVNALCGKVNASRNRSAEDPALLDIRLTAKDGLQIVVRTDGKQSFYEHLSDNTKFLFAYHLLAEAENLAGAILLFDEPNAGFHPSAEGLVLDFLEALADGGNLVVLTTHSQHMIDLDHLTGVRLMSSDEEGALRVSNGIHRPATAGGDILALQPVTEAIGLHYAEQLVVKDKVIVTEGYTDMLYLRVFRRIFGHDAELNVAPLRGESQIGQFVPLLISQGMAFKIVLDSKVVKKALQKDYPLLDKHFFVVSTTAGGDSQGGAGIEDLLMKKDFVRLLTRYGFAVNEKKLGKVTNSNYARQEKVKSALATKLYADGQLDCSFFEQESLNAFERVLDFCASDDWFMAEIG